MPLDRQDAEGFEFPCDFTIKAMGLAEPGFDTIVVQIIRRHCPDIREGAISSRPSRTGKYISVSVVIEASSREQLDAIYDDLTDHHKVLMRL